uniref:Tetraspanin n=1 Tax=Anopheles farauti TaxID=69004 RepID=A0A182QZM8_9DIPT
MSKSLQMGHFLEPDDTSEIEPFEPQGLIYTGSTATGTTSIMGKKGKPNPTIVSSSAAGNNNGQSSSRSGRTYQPTKPKQKTRDSDCCSINFIKYSLHIFNTIFLYTFVLLFVFLLEFIVGGLAYLYETQIETELQHTLNATFIEHYGVSERQTTAIDSMQREFSCCGAVRFEDWRHSVWLRSRRKDLIKPTEGRLVPDSCCITVAPKCGLRDGPSNIHYTVCLSHGRRFSPFVTH